MITFGKRGFFQVTVYSYNITWCLLPLTSPQACMVALELLLVSSWLGITYKMLPGQDCPGGSVIKNLPTNAGDTSSIPAREDSACRGAAEPASHSYPACAAERPAATSGRRHPAALALPRGKPPQPEARHLRQSHSRCLQLEKSPPRGKGPAQPQINKIKSSLAKKLGEMSPGVLPAWRKRKKWRLAEPAHREARYVPHKPGKGRGISRTRVRPPRPGNWTRPGAVASASPAAPARSGRRPRSAAPRTRLLLVQGEAIEAAARPPSHKSARVENSEAKWCLKGGQQSWEGGCSLHTNVSKLKIQVLKKQWRPPRNCRNLPCRSIRRRVRAQSCLSLCDPADCRPPGSSVPGISQEYWTGRPLPSPGGFLTQGSNPHLLHWEVDSLPQSHLGGLRWH